MRFETFFRIVSYVAVFCGFLALWVSGTFGTAWSLSFAAVFVGAWFLEESGWQIGEKLGTALIVLALPGFYGIWHFQVVPSSGGEIWVAGLLARMILCLTAIKLLQNKSDRDWIFLYLMAFFEVLLGAGLSISAIYVLTFLVFLLAIVCSIIAFELRKTSRAVELNLTGNSSDTNRKISNSNLRLRLRRIPTVSVALIIFIVGLAVPLFFLLPRVGGAGFGGNQNALKTTSGFSDSVRLGGIGTIQQSDAVVMRVRLEGTAGADQGLYFRGIALDTFDNQSWSKSKTVKYPLDTGDQGLTRLDAAATRERPFLQTIYLEPLDTPVLFALPRAVAIQGNFSGLDRDQYGSFSHGRTQERISYNVFSDRGLPSVQQLRADKVPYSADVQNYIALPEFFDSRIGELAAGITSRVKNRYDQAKVIESYLQTNLGYTLDQKAGGKQPLSDFLFNIREGHCEYFATAMATMLRTQGIATRIVNGFHGGDYNDAAEVTVVRQRNAHAWVEVYFPGEDIWVPFDPTPFAGQMAADSSSGIAAVFTKYFEAIETFWIQNFVAFDDQGQRSLAKTFKTGFVDYQAKIGTYLGVARDLTAEWLAEVRGDRGLRASLVAIASSVGSLIAVILGVFLFVWCARRASRWPVWRLIWDRLLKRQHDSVVEFYDRMVAILEVQGLRRAPFQTPLEFAYALEISDVVAITERYQKVRFGEYRLSTVEAREIEDMLKTIKKGSSGISGR